jgi:hypothetical protein
MTDAGTMRKATLAVLALPVGIGLALLTLIGTTYLPGDSMALWLGLPVLVLAAGWWVTFRRAPSFAVGLLASGFVALALMVWMLWQFGQGMESFD